MKRNIKILCAICVIFTMYLFESVFILNKFNSLGYIYVVKPITYSLIILILYRIIPNKINIKLRYKSDFIWWSIYASFIHVSVMFLFGAVEGMGKSPYNYDFLSILTNIIIIAIISLLREYIRYGILNLSILKSKSASSIFAVIFITLISIPCIGLVINKNKYELIIFISEIILPILALNIFATYLSYHSGVKASFLYIYCMQVMLVIIPVLPNLTWISKSFITTFSPLFSLVYVNYLYCKKKNKIKEEVKSKQSVKWTLTSFGAVLFLWFVIGVFPVYPKVIATGSMKPIINPGDIVIVKKVSAEVKKNDIIQYKTGQINIFHRVIDISKNELGDVLYTTKGDNNSIPDNEQVKISQIKGKVEYVIPKIGYPTLLLRKNNVDWRKYEF